MREQFMRKHKLRQENLAPRALVMVLDTTRPNKKKSQIFQSSLNLIMTLESLIMLEDR
jgi:hypothetical protein